VYILTCLCPFSKWAEAFPVPNKEAATIARVLVEQIICRFGAPVEGISDRGREVDGAVMREICRLLDIEKWRTSSYHPSGNGVWERFHGTLKSSTLTTRPPSHPIYAAVFEKTVVCLRFSTQLNR